MENKTAESLRKELASILYQRRLFNKYASDVEEIEQSEILADVAFDFINAHALQQTDSMAEKTQVLSDIIVIKDDTIERMKTELAQAKEVNSKLVEGIKECTEAIKWAQDYTTPVDNNHHSDFFNILTNALVNGESLLTPPTEAKEEGCTHEIRHKGVCAGCGHIAVWHE